MRKIRRNIQKSRKNHFNLNLRSMTIAAGLTLAMTVYLANGAFADPVISNNLPVPNNINGAALQYDNTNTVVTDPVTNNVTTPDPTLQGWADNSNRLDVNVNQGVADIKYNSYNIGANRTVNYNFSSNGQVAINRVTVADQASKIFGNITQSGAGGAVFLINPNGILFGATSSVNVDSFVASTLDGTYNPVTRSLNLSRGANIAQGIYLEGDTSGQTALHGNKSLVLTSNAIFSTKNLTSGDAGNAGNIQLVTGDGVNFTFQSDMTANLAKSSDVTAANADGLPQNVVYPNDLSASQAIEMRGGSVLAHNIEAISKISAPTTFYELINLSSVMTANSITGEGGNIYIFAHNEDPTGGTDTGSVSFKIGKTLTAQAADSEHTGTITLESNKFAFGSPTLGKIDAGQVNLMSSSDNKAIHLGSTSQASAYNVSNSMLDRIYSADSPINIAIGKGTSSDISGEINLGIRGSSPLNLVLNTGGQIGSSEAPLVITSSVNDSTLGVNGATNVNIDTVAGNTLKLSNFSASGNVGLTADIFDKMSDAVIDIGGTLALKKKTNGTDFASSELDSIFSNTSLFGGNITIGNNGFTGNVSGSSLYFNGQTVNINTTGNVNLAGISNAGTINIDAGVTGYIEQEANSVSLSGSALKLGDIFSLNDIALASDLFDATGANIMAGSTGSVDITSVTNSQSASSANFISAYNAVSQTGNITLGDDLYSGDVIISDLGLTSDTRINTTGTVDLDNLISNPYNLTVDAGITGYSATEASSVAITSPTAAQLNLGNIFSSGDIILASDNFNVSGNIETDTGKVQILSKDPVLSALAAHFDNAYSHIAKANLIQLGGELNGVAYAGRIEIPDFSLAENTQISTTGDVILHNLISNGKNIIVDDDNTGFIEAASIDITGDELNLGIIDAIGNIVLASDNFTSTGFIASTGNIQIKTTTATTSASDANFDAVYNNIEAGASLVRLGNDDYEGDVSLTGLNIKNPTVISTSNAVNLTNLTGSQTIIVDRQNNSSYDLDEAASITLSGSEINYGKLFSLGAVDLTADAYTKAADGEIRGTTLDIKRLTAANAITSGELADLISSSSSMTGAVTIGTTGFLGGVSGTNLDLSGRNLTVNTSGTVNLASISNTPLITIGNSLQRAAQVDLSGSALNLNDIYSSGNINLLSDLFASNGMIDTTGNVQISTITKTINASYANLNEVYNDVTFASKIIFGDSLYQGNVVFDGLSIHHPTTVSTSGNVQLTSLSGNGLLNVDLNNDGIYNPQEASSVELSGNILNLGKVFSSGDINLTADTYNLDTNAALQGTTFEISTVTNTQALSLDDVVSKSTFGGLVTIGQAGYSGNITGTVLDFDGQDINILTTANIDLEGLSNVGEISIAADLSKAEAVNLEGDLSSLGNIYANGLIKANDTGTTGSINVNGIVDGDVVYIESENQPIIGESAQIITHSGGTGELYSLTLKARSGNFELTNALNSKLHGETKEFATDSGTVVIADAVTDTESSNIYLNGHDFDVTAGSVNTGGWICINDKDDSEISSSLVNALTTSDLRIQSDGNIDILDNLVFNDKNVRFANSSTDSYIKSDSGSITVGVGHTLKLDGGGIDIKLAGAGTVENISGTSVKIAGINDSNINILDIQAGNDVDISSENNLTVGSITTAEDIKLTAGTLVTNNSTLTVNGSVNGAVIELNADNELVLNNTVTSSANDLTVNQSTGNYTVSQDNVNKLVSETVKVNAEAGNIILNNETINSANNYIMTARDFDPATGSFAATGTVELHDTQGNVSVNNALTNAFGAGTLKIYAEDTAAGSISQSESLILNDRDLYLNAYGDIDSSPYNIDLGTGILDLTANGNITVEVASSKVNANGANITLTGTGTSLEALSLTTNGNIDISGNALAVSNISTDGNVKLEGESLTLGDISGGNIEFNTNSYILDGDENISTSGTLTVQRLDNGTLRNIQEGTLLERVSQADSIILGSDSNTGGVIMNGVDFLGAGVLVNTSGKVEINNITNSGTIIVDHGVAGYDSEASDVTLGGLTDLKVGNIFADSGILLDTNGELTTTEGSSQRTAGIVMLSSDTFNIGGTVTADVAYFVEKSTAFSLNQSLIDKLNVSDVTIFATGATITLDGAIDAGDKTFEIDVQDFDYSAGSLATTGTVTLEDTFGDIQVDTDFINAFGSGALKLTANGNIIIGDTTVTDRDIYLSAYGGISSGENIFDHGTGSLELEAYGDVDLLVKGTGTVSNTNGSLSLKLQNVEADQTLTIGTVNTAGIVDISSQGSLITDAITTGGNVTLTVDSDNTGSDYMTINGAVTGSQVALNVDDGLTLNSTITSNAVLDANQLITINSNADILISNTDTTAYHIPVSALISKNIAFNNQGHVFSTYDPLPLTPIDASGKNLTINTGVYAPANPIIADSIIVNSDTIGLNSTLVNTYGALVDLTANNITVLEAININDKTYNLTANNLFDFESGAGITTDKDINIHAKIFDFTNGSLTATGDINLTQTEGDLSIDAGRIVAGDVSVTASAGNINLTGSSSGLSGNYTLTANNFDASSGSIDTTGIVTLNDQAGGLILTDSMADAFGTGKLAINVNSANQDLIISEDITADGRDLSFNATGNIDSRGATPDIYYTISNGSGQHELIADSDNSGLGDLHAKVVTSSTATVDGNDITLYSDSSFAVNDINTSGNVLLSASALTLNDITANNVSLYSDNFTMTSGKAITPGADTKVIISDRSHNTAAADAHFRDVYTAINNLNNITSVDIGDDDYAGNVAISGFDLVADTRINTKGAVSIGDPISIATGDYQFSVDRATVGVVDEQEAVSIGLDIYTSSEMTANIGPLYAEGIINLGAWFPDGDLGGKLIIGEIFSRGDNFQLLSPVDTDLTGDITAAGGTYIFANGDVNLTGDINTGLLFMYAGAAVQPSGNMGDYEISGAINVEGDIQISNNYGKLHIANDITSNTGGISLNADGEIIVDGNFTSHGICMGQATIGAILGSNSAITVNGNLSSEKDVYINSGLDNLGDFTLASTGSISTKGEIEIISEEDVLLNGALTADGEISTLDIQAKGNIETANTITVTKAVTMTADSDSTGDDHVLIGGILNAGGPLTFNADSVFTNTAAVTATNGDLITINAESINPLGVISSKVAEGTNTIRIGKNVGDLDLSTISHPENLIADILEFNAAGAITLGDLVFTGLTDLTLSAGTSITSNSGTSIGGLNTLDLSAGDGIDINTGSIGSISISNASDIKINGGNNDVNITTIPDLIVGAVDISGAAITVPDIIANEHVIFNGTQLNLANITSNNDDIFLTSSGNISAGNLAANHVSVDGAVVKVGDLNVSGNSALTGKTSLEMANITASSPIALILKAPTYIFTNPATDEIKVTADGTVYISDGLDKVLDPTQSAVTLFDHITEAHDVVLGDNGYVGNIDLSGLNLAYDTRVSTTGDGAQYGIVNLTDIRGSGLLTVDTLDHTDPYDQANSVTLASIDPAVFNIGNVYSEGLISISSGSNCDITTGELHSGSTVTVASGSAGNISLDNIFAIGNVAVSSGLGAELNLSDITSNGNITLTSDDYGTSGNIKANADTGIVTVLAVNPDTDFTSENLRNLINNVSQAQEIKIGKGGYRGDVYIDGLDIASKLSVSTSANVMLENIANSGELNINNYDTGYNFSSEAKYVTLSGNMSSLGKIYAARIIDIDNLSETGTLSINRVRTQKEIDITSDTGIVLVAGGEINALGYTMISSNGDIDINGNIISHGDLNILSNGHILQNAGSVIMAYNLMDFEASNSVDNSVTINGTANVNGGVIINASADLLIGGTLYGRTTNSTMDIMVGNDILTTGNGIIKSKGPVTLYAENDIDITTDLTTEIDPIHYNHLNINRVGAALAPLALEGGAVNTFSSPGFVEINSVSSAMYASSPITDTIESTGNNSDNLINGLENIVPAINQADSASILFALTTNSENENLNDQDNMLANILN